MVTDWLQLPITIDIPYTIYSQSICIAPAMYDLTAWNALSLLQKLTFILGMGATFIDSHNMNAAAQIVLYELGISYESLDRDTIGLPTAAAIFAATHDPTTIDFDSGLKTAKNVSKNVAEPAFAYNNTSVWTRAGITNIHPLADEANLSLFPAFAGLPTITVICTDAVVQLKTDKFDPTAPQLMPNIYHTA